MLKRVIVLFLVLSASISGSEPEGEQQHQVIEMDTLQPQTPQLTAVPTQLSRRQRLKKCITAPDNGCVARTSRVIGITCLSVGVLFSLLSAFQVGIFCEPRSSSCTDRCSCSPLIEITPRDGCPCGFDSSILGLFDIYSQDNQTMVNANVLCRNPRDQNDLFVRRLTTRYRGCLNNCGQNIDSRSVPQNRTLSRCCAYRSPQIAQRSESKPERQPVSRGRR